MLLRSNFGRLRHYVLSVYHIFGSSNQRALRCGLALFPSGRGSLSRHHEESSLDCVAPQSGYANALK